MFVLFGFDLFLVSGAVAVGVVVVVVVVTLTLG